MATKTLSVRLPLDVHENIENICKQRKINKNRLLQEIISSEGVVNINTYSTGGEVQNVPDFLHDVLVGIGGVATGTIVYHILKNNLPKDWDENTIEMVSFFSAIASGFGMAYGLHKTSKK